MNIQEAILEKIDSLPPLPETITKIEEICNNPKSSARDLIDVVEKDPLLTANLLKVANSPYYGFTSKITSVGHAIALFGMTTVLGFAMSSAVRKNFKDMNLSPYGITPEDFARSSFKQNKLMIMWHFSIDIENSDILVPASFVNEIGKVVLSEVIIEKNLKDEFLKEILETENENEVERKFLDTSTPEITGKILYKWRMNINIVYPIISSENPEEADDNLKLSAYAIKIVRTAVGAKGDISKASINKALQLIDTAGLNKKDFLLAIKKLM